MFETQLTYFIALKSSSAVADPSSVSSGSASAFQKHRWCVFVSRKPCHQGERASANMNTTRRQIQRRGVHPSSKEARDRPIAG